MALLVSLLSDALCLTITGMDVLCFFIVVRLLARHLSLPGLTAFDNVGRPLVRWFIAHVERGLNRISPRNRSEQAVLACGLASVAMLRFCFAVIATVLSRV